MIIACDWNKDLSKDHDFISEIGKINLILPDIPTNYTYKTGNRESKIDFYAFSKD
jgi:hypothetical protein